MALPILTFFFDVNVEVIENVSSADKGWKERDEQTIREPDLVNFSLRARLKRNFLRID